MKNQKTVRYLTRGALIAALYVAITYLCALLGLASGAIQFRLSEALCILPAFMPEATAGLFIGCLLANLVTGSAMIDVILGSIATLIGAIGARMLRGVRQKWLLGVPTVLANAIIVPIAILYSATNTLTLVGFVPIALGVAVGEIVCACILGALLYRALERANLFS